MPRLFVAFRPPESIRDRLIDLMEGPPALRWQPDDQLHLTLKFFGEVDRRQAEDLVLALRSVVAPRFALRLDGIGRFARRSGGALWAGIAPREPVAALAQRIDRAGQAAGLAPDHRTFHPHLTLARWNGAQPPLEAWFQANAALTSDPWPVDRFTLFSSELSRHGAHHEPLVSFPLD